MTKPAWLFVLCSCWCVSAASCSKSSSTTLRRCVRAGDAELCGNRSASGIALEAKGLKPGSTVKLSSPATGSGEIIVGGDVHLVGTNGIITSTDYVVTVAASAANGDPLAGELSFPKS